MLKEKENKTDFPAIISELSNVMTWSGWLEEIEKTLRELGYTKYNQKTKNSTFVWAKNFYINNEKCYQIALLFYDYREFKSLNINAPECISVQFECMLLNVDSRIDLSISKNITLKEFEKISETFYNSMIKFAK